MIALILSGTEIAREGQEQARRASERERDRNMDRYSERVPWVTPECMGNGLWGCLEAKKGDDGESEVEHRGREVTTATMEIKGEGRKRHMVCDEAGPSLRLMHGHDPNTHPHIHTHKHIHTHTHTHTDTHTHRHRHRHRHTQRHTDTQTHSYTQCQAMQINSLQLASKPVTSFRNTPSNTDPTIPTSH
jgi:hypothetical protein